MLAWLHRGIGLMNLQQKEKYGKTAGPLWSSVLMGFLRNNDALDPAEDAPARLANCDDLRPLEQDNCLWDILLLHRYVELRFSRPMHPRRWNALPSMRCWSRGATRRRIKPWQSFSA